MAMLMDLLGAWKRGFLAVFLWNKEPDEKSRA